MRMPIVRRVLAVGLVAALLPSVRAGEETSSRDLDSLQAAFAESVSAVNAATVVVDAADASGRTVPCSGVMISKNGVVLSSVWAGAYVNPSDDLTWTTTAVKVRIPRREGRGYEVVRGEVVERHRPTGTSLIVCERRGGTQWPRLRIGDSGKAVVGMFTLTGGLTAGDDEDALPSVNAGVISCVVPPRDGKKGLSQRFFTDASGTGSMRGGPVTDVAGHLIGVLTQPRSEREGLRFAGLSAVAPIRTVLTHYQGVEWTGDAASRIRQALKSRASRRRGKTAAHALQAVIHDAVSRAHPSVVAMSATQAFRITDRAAVGAEFIDVPRLHEAFSGIVVSGDGLVLTSLYNVCTPALVSLALKDPTVRATLDRQLKGYADLTIHTLGGVVFDGAVVASEPRLGAALIRARIEASKDAGPWPAPMPACPAGDLVPGRFVVTVGNPYLDPRVSPVVTWGVLSRCFEGVRPEPWAGQWLTDAGVVGANCGGAAVDLEGRLIGMPTIWSVAEHGLNSGIGFIVPWAELEGFIGWYRKEKARPRRD